VAGVFADTFHNLNEHGLQINLQKAPFKVEIFKYIFSTTSLLCFSAQSKQKLRRK
jgi:hypothetical protein